MKGWGERLCHDKGSNGGERDGKRERGREGGGEGGRGVRGRATDVRE